MHGAVGYGVRVGGNGGNSKKAESHPRRSESTQLLFGCRAARFFAGSHHIFVTQNGPMTEQQKRAIRLLPGFKLQVIMRIFIVYVGEFSTKKSIKTTVPCAPVMKLLECTYQKCRKKDFFTRLATQAAGSIAIRARPLANGGGQGPFPIRSCSMKIGRKKTFFSKLKLTVLPFLCQMGRV